jgi:undecaprenyl-diphosphatase
MTPFQSIVLGIVQGLTEFLPISSSGHLVIVPYLLGWQLIPSDAFIFDVLVQVATLVAVIAYFWKDLVEIAQQMLHCLLAKKPFAASQARLGWYLLLSTLPAGFLGLLLKETVEQAFASARVTGFFLLLTALLLSIAEKAGKRNVDLDQINWKDALWIGFSQVLAIFPGVSRSGATIAGGMTRNLDRASAARFAFLMSIPVMLAAGFLAFIDLIQIQQTINQTGAGNNNLILSFTPGFIASAITGYLSIRWLIGYLKEHSLYLFALYCSILGIIIVITSYLN